MSFSERDLRRGMDVFSSDGVYLGSVIHVRRLARRLASAPAGPSTEDAPTSAAFSGEALGPMPTVALGNRGPARQRQATTLPSGDGPADFLVFRTLVALNWRLLWPRLRRYPVSLVLHVSHERIVLAATDRELDDM